MAFVTCEIVIADNSKIINKVNFDKFDRMPDVVFCRGDVSLLYMGYRLEL